MVIKKNPTWQSLQPGLPSYQLLESNQSHHLQKKLNLPGTLYQVAFDSTASNFYMIHNEASQQKYFIKFITNDQQDHYKQAEQIACWLQNEKINACAALKYINAVSENGYYYIYPLLEGIRLPETQESLMVLGKSLAQLHQTLKNYPDYENLQLKTHKRMSQLQMIREDIANGRLTIGPIPEFVKSLAQNQQLDFTKGESIQPLHGDLNPGNLLLNNQDIYYFDFEDTLHSVLPSIYELVYVLERLIFTRISDSKSVIELGKALIASYLKNGGNYSYQETDKYAQTSLALRSLCVLTWCGLEEKKIDDDEWYKFQKLTELSQKMQPILKEILCT